MTKRKHHDQADAPVLPTPEQLRRHRYEPWRPDKGDKDSAMQDARGTLRRRDGSVVDYLYACGHLSGREWLASVRLRKDAHLAGIEARVTGTYEQTIPGCGGDTAAWKIDAERRWREALRAVGQQLAAPLVAVVIEDVPAGVWAESALGYGSRSASAVGVALLRAALGALADFYQLP